MYAEKLGVHLIVEVGHVNDFKVDKAVLEPRVSPAFAITYICNKAVLEPRVSPAFAITYFCNHCNIRFENTSKYVDTLTLLKKLEPKVIDPKMTFDPKSVEVTCVTLPKGHCVQVPQKYIKVCGYSDPFFQNLKQRSLTPR